MEPLLLNQILCQNSASYIDSIVSELKSTSLFFVISDLAFNLVVVSVFFPLCFELYTCRHATDTEQASRLCPKARAKKHSGPEPVVAA